MSSLLNWAGSWFRPTPEQQHTNEILTALYEEQRALSREHATLSNRKKELTRNVDTMWGKYKGWIEDDGTFHPGWFRLDQVQTISKCRENLEQSCAKIEKLAMDTFELRTELKTKKINNELSSISSQETKEKIQNTFDLNKTWARAICMLIYRRDEGLKRCEFEWNICKETKDVENPSPDQIKAIFDRVVTSYNGGNIDLEGQTPQALKEKLESDKKVAQEELDAFAP